MTECSVPSLAARRTNTAAKVEAKIMSKSVEKKIQVKLTLSKKYERLAGLAGSKVKQNTFLWHAKHFRLQADVMLKKLEHEKSLAK
jgi:hypothetical protein